MVIIGMNQADADNSSRPTPSHSLETIMPDVTIEEAQAQLRRGLEAFELEHPEVVEAMRAMNISYSEYLKALAAQRDQLTTSGNALI